MAVRFRDTATGELLEADTPELEAEASVTPGLQRYDLLSPVLFKDTKSGEVFGATDLGLAEEAERDPNLRRLTQQEYTERFAKEAAEERKRIEAEAGAAFSAERPIRSAIGAGLLGLARTTLPVVGSAIAERMGLPAEEQAALEKQFPVSSRIGTGLGLAGTIGAALGTGGLSAAAGAAGKVAATEAAAVGAGRIGQALAAARAAAGVAPAAVEATAPVVSAGARAGLATEAAIKALAPKAAETIVGKGLAGAAGATAAIGLPSALTEAAESYVEGREFSGESIVSNMKLGALLGGTLSSVPAAVSKGAAFYGNTEAGKKYLSSLGRSRAERIYSKHAPDIFAKTSKQISYPQTVELVNEAAERGLVGEFMDASVMSTKARAAMDESGQRLRQIAEEADERLGAPVDASGMWQRIVDNIIAPRSAAGTMQNERVARQLADEVEAMRSRGGDKLTLKQLWDFRKAVDDEVFGFSKTSIKDPNRTQFYNSYRQFRHEITREMEQAFKAAKIPDSVWKAAQRDYQVASHAERIANKSLVSAVKKSGMDMPDFLIKAASVGAGALSGSAATGLEALLSLSALRAAAPRGREWANAALQRAIRGGAPKEIVEDYAALSRKAAEEAESAVRSISVMPEEAATNQFRSLYSDVTDALSKPMPEYYRKALQEAQDEMMIGYTKALRLSEPGSVVLDVNAVGDSLERARDIISKASIPTRAGARVKAAESFIGAQEQAYEAMRALSANMTASLADPKSSWGAARAYKTDKELRRLYAMYTDPARIAKIQSLQEAANKARQTVQQKSSKLMGVTAAVHPIRPKLERMFEPLQSESVQRLEQDIGIEEPEAAGGTP